MGKSKKSSALNFRVLSVSQADPRLHSDNPPQNTFKFFTPLNSKADPSTPLPTHIAALFKPEDLGIHDQLTHEQKEALCLKIYGQPTPPVNTIKIVNKKKSRRVTFDEYGDYYFPDDGYDYEQHMRVNSISAKNEHQEAQNDILVGDNYEELEMAEMLEEGCFDEDELEDDFIQIAEDEQDVTEIGKRYDYLLWGSRKHLLDDDEYDNYDMMNEPSTQNTVSYSEYLKTHPQVSEEDMYSDIDDTHKEEELPPLEHTDILKTLNFVENMSENSNEDEEVEISPPKEEWDSETVLTRLSNIYNHPFKLGKPTTHIKLKTKHQYPTEFIDTHTHQKSTHTIHEEEYIDLPDVITVRRPDETPEEKRYRKQLVKQAKRITRATHKQNSLLHKEELMKVNQKVANSAYNVPEKTTYFHL